jgi:hypothetical protein
MQIDVIDVSKPAFTKTDKGGYNKIEVAYKEGGKVTGKQLVDFGAGKSVYDFFIANPKPGSVVITTEKNGKYVNWTAVAPATAGASNQSQESEAPPAAAGTGSRGRVTGSNYETPEERTLRRDFDKLKHRQIGRQGCINAAINTLARDGTKELDTAQVLAIAKVYEDFVFGTVQSNAVSETYQGEPVPVG